MIEESRLDYKSCVSIEHESVLEPSSRSELALEFMSFFKILMMRFFRLRSERRSFTSDNMTINAGISCENFRAFSLTFGLSYVVRRKVMISSKSSG